MHDARQETGGKGCPGTHAAPEAAAAPLQQAQPRRIVKRPLQPLIQLWRQRMPAELEDKLLKIPGESERLACQL